MAKRSTRKEMVLLLAVYAAVLTIMGIDQLMESFDRPPLDISLDVIILVLFGAAAFFMFLGRILGYYAMIAALIMQVIISLSGYIGGIGAVSVNDITSTLALLTVNAFIILWLLQGENRILFR